MKKSSIDGSIYELVIKTLKEMGGMDDLMITKRLVCVGEDGASMIQGQRIGICVKLQLLASPFMISIHCMAHRMILAFKILRKFPSVSKVEELVHKTHAYFCCSPKRFTWFQQFADGIIDRKIFIKRC